MSDCYASYIKKLYTVYCVLYTIHHCKKCDLLKLPNLYESKKKWILHDYHIQLVSMALYLQMRTGSCRTPLDWGDVPGTGETPTAKKIETGYSESV